MSPPTVKTRITINGRSFYAKVIPNGFSSPCGFGGFFGTRPFYLRARWERVAEIADRSGDFDLSEKKCQLAHQAEHGQNEEAGDDITKKRLTGK
ncbi:MAG: hypothetical protein RL703_838 [Pseudomonadota bacterium]